MRICLLKCKVSCTIHKVYIWYSGYAQYIRLCLSTCMTSLHLSWLAQFRIVIVGRLECTCCNSVSSWVWWRVSRGCVNFAEFYE